MDPNDRYEGGPVGDDTVKTGNGISCRVRGRRRHFESRGGLSLEKEGSRRPLLPPVTTT